MSGIHYDDLKQIHTAFGLLDEDTQTRMEACKRVECYISGRWVRLAHPHDLHEEVVYRQAHGTDRPIDVDHHALGAGIYCWARDAVGRVFAYRDDPTPGGVIWMSPSVQRWPLTGLALLRDPGTGDWRKSKVINPLWEGEK